MDSLTRNDCQSETVIEGWKMKCGLDFNHDGKHEAEVWTEGNGDTTKYTWDNAGNKWVDGYVYDRAPLGEGA